MKELLWNAPVSENKMGRCIEALDLNTGDRVLDVGCGCGEVLLRVADRYGVHARGVDVSAESIAEAKRRLESRGHDRVEFLETDVTEYSIPDASYDLVMCLGASHAFGLGSDAVPRAIRRMARIASDDGLVLIADGYLKQPKPDEYRSFLGDDVPDDLTLPAIVGMGREAGLIPLGVWVSSDDEWDEFEWSYQRIVEHRARLNSADEAAQRKLRGRREWMEGYLNWGRDTLGYATFLFWKPGDGSAT